MRPIGGNILKSLRRFLIAIPGLWFLIITINAANVTGNAEPGPEHQNSHFAAKPKEYLLPPPDIQPIPAKGRFLVASKKLLDPRFRESVILLIEYSPRGSMGLIINQPTTVLLTDLIKDLPALKTRKDIAFYGGPVEPNRMFLLIRSPNNVEESFKVMDGVYMSMSRAILEQVASGKLGVPFKSFAGYSGWAAGQLDAEISRGDWYVTNGDARMIFERDPKKIWLELIRVSTTIQV